MYHHVPLGEKAPDMFNAIIEISKGSQNKYEYDEKLDLIKLDRVLYSPFFYPLDYGFIPETRSADGDHLDVMVIGSMPLVTGTLVECRPIGLLKMIDDGDEDFKVIAVQAKNPRMDWLTDLPHLETGYGHMLKEIKHFFEHMKDLQGKKVEVQGYENSENAKKAILEAHETFKREQQ